MTKIKYKKNKNRNQVLSYTEKKTLRSGMIVYIPGQEHKQTHPTHALDSLIALQAPHKTLQLYDSRVLNLYPRPCETVLVQTGSSTRSANKFMMFKAII